MEEDEDLDLASLGFTSFGTQPSAKKRRINDSAFTSVSATDPTNTPSLPQRAKTGANNVALGRRSEQKAELSDRLQGFIEDSPRADERQMPVEGQVYVHSEAELKVLSEGLGSGSEVVYFKKSFVEDPWARLKNA